MPLYLQHISDELKTATIYGKKMIDSDTCSSKLHFSFLSCLNITVIYCPILNSAIFQERSLIFIFLSCLCVCDLHVCMGVCLGLSVCFHLCSGPRLMLRIILHCSTFLIWGKVSQSNTESISSYPAYSWDPVSAFRLKITGKQSHTPDIYMSLGDPKHY